MKHLTLLLLVLSSIAVSGQTINNYNNFACCGASGASINAINGTDTCKLMQADSAYLQSTQTVLDINRRIFTPKLGASNTIPVTITGAIQIPSTTAIGTRTPYLVVADSAQVLSTTTTRMPACIASCDSLYWTVDAVGNIIQRDISKNVTIGNTTSLGDKLNVDGGVTITGQVTAVTTNSSADDKLGYDNGSESAFTRFRASQLKIINNVNSSGGDYANQQFNGNTGTVSTNSTGAISFQGSGGTGFVGIGTASPSNLLDIYGGNFNQANINANYGVSIISATDLSGAGINMHAYDNNGAGGVTLDVVDDHMNSQWDDGTGTSTNNISITSDGVLLNPFSTDGNVGIGTASPIAKLHLVGQLFTYMEDSTLTNTISASNNTGSRVGSAGVSYQGWGFTSTDADVSTVTSLSGDNSTGVIQLQAWTGVGIGTATPAAKLDVLGTFHQYVDNGSDRSSLAVFNNADGIKLETTNLASNINRISLERDGSGVSIYSTNAVNISTGTITIDMPSKANGYVLTSDASGNATWQAGAVGNYPHVIFTPTTGSTITLTNNANNIINPAGALLALTVTFPASPSDNDVVKIKFTKAVTTVTYAGGTVVDGITSPVLGQYTEYTFDTATSSWY